MKKSILSPLFSALVFPGAGQLVNRQFLKGAVLVLGGVLVFVLMYIQTSGLFAENMAKLEGMSPEELAGWAMSASRRIPFSVRAGLWALFGLWVYGIVDAYLVGKKLDREREAGSERGYNG